MASTFSNDGNRDQGVAGGGAAVSARKLAAALWQLAVTTGCGGDVRWQCRLSDGLGFEFCSAPPTPKSSMEGVTKWDYRYSNASGDISHGRLPEYQERETTSVATPTQAGLSKDKKCMNKHKAKEGLSKTRVKRCTKKLNEEGASWMTTQHQQICGTVKELKDDVRRVRNNCNKMNILYSNLLSEMAEAKSSASKFKHSYEKEKKARELLEDLCIEQAKELGANKAEIKELRIQCARIQQELVEDRKMLQMAEAWREERARMKLVDAKLILEDKYSQMNKLIENMNELLRSSNYAKNINEMSNADVLEEDFDTRKMQGIREFLCTLPNSDKEFTNINLEACASTRTSVQSSISSGSGCASGDTSGEETIRKDKNVADHECQKADSCEISVSSKHKL